MAGKTTNFRKAFFLTQRFFFIIFLFCVCASACVRVHTCGPTTAWMWESWDKLQSQFSPSMWVQVPETQAVRLGSGCLYLLSHPWVWHLWKTICLLWIYRRISHQAKHTPGIILLAGAESWLPFFPYLLTELVETKQKALWVWTGFCALAYLSSVLLSIKLGIKVYFKVLLLKSMWLWHTSQMRAQSLCQLTANTARRACRLSCSVFCRWLYHAVTFLCRALKCLF